MPLVFGQDALEKVESRKLEEYYGGSVENRHTRHGLRGEQGDEMG